MIETFLTISELFSFVNPLKVVDKEVIVKFADEVSLNSMLFGKSSSMFDALFQN